MNKLLLLALLIANSVDSLVIDCHFRAAGLNVIDDVYQCDSAGLPATSPSPFITDTSGTHQSGKSNDDVTSVLINGGNTLSYLPRTSRVFPNLLAYSIFDATFDTLLGDEFDNMPQLQFVAIWNSRLTTVSGRLFANTPNLISVGFFFNAIERVGPNLFAPLDATQLRDVNFTGNRCIHQFEHTREGIEDLIGKLKEQCHCAC
jgi:hypothetical protein